MPGSSQQKDRPKAVSLLRRCAGYQVTLSVAPFCFRRYAMKPTPKKPRSIIAQVEGSGTAAEIEKRGGLLSGKLNPGANCWANNVGGLTWGLLPKKTSMTSRLRGPLRSLN